LSATTGFSNNIYIPGRDSQQYNKSAAGPRCLHSTLIQNQGPENAKTAAYGTNTSLRFYNGLLFVVPTRT